ncbi:hypothetical protein WICPIJ_003876 [Wickerhamomyces pijperi]|uniref:Uncharacterized protein n=1 Tax=Wickerhamomyces pijperi TaxID=599730 RepID=A0A9P8Q701_WICPI|nr:hypothetical protein WICPIJ_003876 [Wickerhamomyces pijperi]
MDSEVQTRKTSQHRQSSNKTKIQLEVHPELAGLPQVVRLDNHADGYGHGNAQRCKNRPWLCKDVRYGEPVYRKPVECDVVEHSDPKQRVPNQSFADGR